ncbi:uncharacterized protein LOC122090677 [Macadamia integrifolia]|uniref:uncharacterized protein LOC122090677 n=1 Tax=Macadamia integrifolia TaxID=60698 RepID=UPI001C4FA8EE|nr:uncharacterized protein LOC122090677 [Macadamia integrifolia]
MERPRKRTCGGHMLEGMSGRDPSVEGGGRLLPSGSRDKHSRVPRSISAIPRGVPPRGGPPALATYGHPNMVREWYKILLPTAKRLIDDTCLCRLALLETKKFDPGLMRGLIERWWPNTHSFHLPVGEITITPFCFYALTGIPFGSRPLILPETMEADDFLSLTGIPISTDQNSIALGEITARWWEPSWGD